MATVRPVEPATDDAAVARRSRAERSRLRRELGRLDAVGLLISAIVVLDTLGAVARAGAQTLTWLAVVAAQVGLLGGFTATVIVYAAGHGLHGPAAGELAPSWAVFVLVAPVLIHNFLGFELPSAAAEELVDPARDVPASIVRAGALTCALYAVPVLAVSPWPTWSCSRALVRLRHSQPDRPRPIRVPGGPAGALSATALATGWSALALAAALWPGLGTGDPDAHLPDGFAGDRLGFTLAEPVPLAAVLLTPSLLIRRRR